MCLIIHSPKGQTIERSVIESALFYNADGFGLMHSGSAQKWKALSADNIEAELLALVDTDYAVHFRMATDGKVTKKLSHPFKLNNRAYLMHNGILSKDRTDKNATESDTTRFVAEFCNPLIAKHGSIPVSALEQEIIGSKICLMQKCGTINRYGGDWLEYDGNYYSNTYAWDYPLDKSSLSMSRYGSRRSWDDIVDMADDGTITVEINRDYSLIADNIVDALIPVCQDLPLSTPDHIYYDDMALWDMLLAGELCEQDFIECCCNETLLELYSIAIRDSLIYV